MKTFLLRYLFPPRPWAHRDAYRRRRAGVRWLAMLAA